MDVSDGTGGPSRSIMETTVCGQVWMMMGEWTKQNPPKHTHGPGVGLMLGRCARKMLGREVGYGQKKDERPMGRMRDGVCAG